MDILSTRWPRVTLLVGYSLLAVWTASAPSMAQNQILNGKDEVELTPAQRAIVDKIIKAPETVNIGVIKNATSPEQLSSQNRYARLALPFAQGKDITLVRTRPTVKSNR